MSEPTYKVGVIARLFGVSERRVQQLAKDAIIPKSVKGKYELVGCVRGYIAFLQERAFGKEMMTIDAHQERARLLKAQADKTELEVKMLSGNLISVEEARHAWAGMVMTCRAKILSIPTRGAQLVAGLTEFHEVENALKGLANEILNEFSDYDPKSSRGIDTRGGEAVCAAAIDDSQPVGGQSPALK